MCFSYQTCSAPTEANFPPTLGGFFDWFRSRRPNQLLIKQHLTINIDFHNQYCSSTRTCGAGALSSPRGASMAKISTTLWSHACLKSYICVLFKWSKINNTETVQRSLSSNVFHRTRSVRLLCFHGYACDIITFKNNKKKISVEKKRVLCYSVDLMALGKTRPRVNKDLKRKRGRSSAGSNSPLRQKVKRSSLFWKNLIAGLFWNLMSSCKRPDGTDVPDVGAEPC